MKKLVVPGICIHWYEVWQMGDTKSWKDWCEGVTVLLVTTALAISVARLLQGHLINPGIGLDISEWKRLRHRRQRQSVPQIQS